MEAPRWYIALIVLRSASERDPSAPSFIDVQYRLVRAESPDSAYERALELGASAEHEYENSSGETVCWRFAGLRDLRQIMDGAPSDGVEVYSDMSEGGDVDVLAKSRLTVFAKPT